MVTHDLTKSAVVMSLGNGENPEIKLHEVMAELRDIKELIVFLVRKDLTD